MVDRDRSDDLSLFPDERATSTGPVACLGMTFASDEARRPHFLQALKELPELRKRPEFPLAEDEDILRLSAPRVANVLTQDVPLAPIDASVIPLPHRIPAGSPAVAGERGTVRKGAGDVLRT